MPSFSQASSTMTLTKPREQGLFYAPDPASKKYQASAATSRPTPAASGVRYGSTRDNVLGLKVVLADGRLLDLGANQQASLWLNLTQLFVGSEGTLGTIVKLVKLLPLPWANP